MEALSADLERKIKALVSGGYYSSEIEVIKDAVKKPVPRERGIEY